MLATNIKYSDKYDDIVPAASVACVPGAILTSTYRKCIKVYKITVSVYLNQT